MQRTPSIAIIGAGMSGLCLAAKLKLAGIDSFTIYEQATDLGGTWRDNTYPGLTCDVPSRFYQFRFAPNPDWTRWFSAGREIGRYFDGVADRLGVREHVELGAEVVAARQRDARWEIELAGGRTVSADFLVTATGILRIPNVPDIPGVEDFEGAIFHSARWDHSVSVEGRRVAVVGTGSTGAQIVAGLAGVAGRVDLYQRTPQWILPMANPRYSRLTRALHRRVPALGRLAYDRWKALFGWLVEGFVRPCGRRRVLQAMCRLHLRTVKDPALRAALTPDYQPMCKRIVVSSAFYRAIQREDVGLVTDGIARIVADGIVTADGTHHPADVIALATGFDAHAHMRPMRIENADGLSLDEAWADGPRAHMTMQVPGFPNFFAMLGPHSPVGNYSLTEIAETQADHVIGWVRRWQAGAFDTVAPTEAATARFNAEMRRAMPGTVWATGCSSWYLGADGLPELWPWTPARHRELLSEVDPADYTVTTASSREHAFAV